MIEHIAVGWLFGAWIFAVTAWPGTPTLWQRIAISLGWPIAVVVSGLFSLRPGGEFWR